MNKDNPKVVIGFIIFGDHTAPYLPYFLDSLKKQTYTDFKAFAFDSLKMKKNNNGIIKDDSSSSYIRSNYPEIEIIEAPRNTGFGRSHNRMIDMAFRQGAKYYLVINADTILEKDALRIMVEALDNNNEISAVSPKVLKWDFKNNKKTDIIDTLGIGLKQGLMFYDVRQGDHDDRNTNKAIIGPSGSCGLYRLSALADIAEAGKYFDENMFMYKEDCDLAYRLCLSGHRSKTIFDSVIYHDRTASADKGIFGVLKSRKNKNRLVKKWSFFNQLMIFHKYFHRQNLFSKSKIILWKLSALIYSLIFEQYIVFEYIKFLKFKKNIKKI